MRLRSFGPNVPSVVLIIALIVQAGTTFSQALGREDEIKTALTTIR